MGDKMAESAASDVSDYPDTDTDTPELMDYEEEAETDVLLSANGTICWSKRRPEGQGNPPAALNLISGPTRMASSQAKDMVSTFKLFLPHSIEKIIMENTNLEGRWKFGDQWVDMDSTEFYAYIGLLILIGLYKSKGEAVANLWDFGTGRHIISGTMDLERFRAISVAIRFTKHETEVAESAEDKLAPIRDVWDFWVDKLGLLYNLEKDIAVTERLIPFKGRCDFRQHIPNKPGKYAIKLWQVCDSISGYVWNVQLYTGDTAVGSEKMIRGTRVVLDLTKGLKGHTVFCDSFFASFELGQELLNKKMLMVGAVRRSMPELPFALRSAKGRPVHSSEFVFTPTTTLVSYVPRKHKSVLFMSTSHKAGRVKGPNKEPWLMFDYKRTMGAVKRLNESTTTHICRRETSRWPLALFFDMLNISLQNSFVIWNKVSPTSATSKLSSKLSFLQALGEALVTPAAQQRSQLSHNPFAASLVWRAVQASSVCTSLETRIRTGEKGRRRCRFCKGNDHRTNVVCGKCGVYICKRHTAYYCQACSH